MYLHAGSNAQFCNMQMRCQMKCNAVSAMLSQETVDQQIALCPPLADLSPFFEKIPDLGRKLRIATPCIGLHTAGYALSDLGIEHEAINGFDLEDSYRSALESMGMDHVSLKLGKTEGDLMKAGLQSLDVPVDMIIAGPPCPPFSSQGSGLGLKDPRAKVLDRWRPSEP
jgi:hypothetical protein